MRGVGGGAGPIVPHVAMPIRTRTEIYGFQTETTAGPKSHKHNRISKVHGSYIMLTTPGREKDL